MPGALAFETISSQQVIAPALWAQGEGFPRVLQAKVRGGGVSYPLKQHKLVYPKSTLLSQLVLRHPVENVNAVLQSLPTKCPPVGSEIQRHSAASPFSAKGLCHHA